jgi:hypothetical protein
MGTRALNYAAALQSFSQARDCLGYAQGTVATHIRFAQHFLDWAKCKGARMTDLSDEWIDRFERRVIRCASPRATAPEAPAVARRARRHDVRTRAAVPPAVRRALSVSDTALLLRGRPRATETASANALRPGAALAPARGRQTVASVRSP